MAKPDDAAPVVVERRDQKNESLELDAPTGGSVSFSPMVDEDYWSYRVLLGQTGQAVVAFPKHSTIGIGFAREEDWNTNLPWKCTTDEILEHIWHNAGADEQGDTHTPDFTRAEARNAIWHIQSAIAADQGVDLDTVIEDFSAERPHRTPGVTTEIIVTVYLPDTTTEGDTP